MTLRPAPIRSAPVDGFALAYDRTGEPGRPAVVLLHGWPGDRRDHRLLAPLLAGRCDVIVPDLRGFGDSDRHAADPAEAYSAAAQARSVAGLIDELGVAPVVLAGYDVGSRVAQALSTARPDLVAAQVLAPPLPGVGERILGADQQREFWYQYFHRLPTCTELIDGSPAAVRSYLRHFWQHWSGPAFVIDEDEFDALVTRYARPGAFTASIAWYRAGAGTAARALAERPPAPADRVDVPTAVLWPDRDPLFPRAWSDRLDEFFAEVELRTVDGVGHYAPLEYPGVMAEAVLAALPPHA